MCSQIIILTTFLITFSTELKLLTDNTPDWSDNLIAAKSMTASLQDDEQKAIALFKWVALFRHQVPPAHDSLSDATVPLKHPQYGIIYNPIKLANNYGNTFCVSTNSIVPLLWRKLGKESREFDIYAHTVCELKWNDRWHHFDAAFGFFYKDTATGIILDCKDIVARQKIAVSTMMSDFTYCNRFDTAKNNGSFYQNTKIHKILYNTEEYSNIESVRDTLFTEKYSDNYTYQLKVKPYESYTRYFHQIADSFKYFLPADVAGNKNPNATAIPFLNIVVNGLWRFSPDFSSPSALESFGLIKNITSENGVLHTVNPKDTAELVYRVDAANVICHAEMDGTFERVKEKSYLEILFSADSSNWYSLYVANGKSVEEKAFNLSFGKTTINLARTRISYFIKIKMKAAKKPADCVLRSLNVRTYTIVNPRTLPLLTLGSNRVKYLSNFATPIGISFHWTEVERSETGTLLNPRSFSKNIKTSSEEWAINTAGMRNPNMDSIVVNWNGSSLLKDGYNDNKEVGAKFEVPKYYYTFGKNIALGKPITAIPTTDSINVLNDNIGGPRQFAAVWPKAANPVVTIEMSQKTLIAAGGVRILQSLSNQNNEYFDSCIVFTSRDNKIFKKQGKIVQREVYEPITNYLHQNSWDQPAFRSYRNSNIARYKFSSTFETPDSVKSIRLAFFNSLSELRIEEVEVYDKMAKRQVVNEIDHGFSLPDPSASARY
jgi:hypothetical protein